MPFRRETALAIKIRTKIDRVQFQQLSKKIADVRGGLTAEQARTVGQAVADEMHDMISKGISPIDGAGRFPEYKAVAALRSEKRLASGLNDARRVGGYRGAHDGELSNQFKRAVDTIGDLQRRGYPYSVQKDYPSKRPRPVNLYLSGDQMADLGVQGVYRARSGYGAAVGYPDGSDAAKKEQGHAQGVGGQPRRATIPPAGATFASRIQRIIVGMIRGFIGQTIKK